MPDKKNTNKYIIGAVVLIALVIVFQLAKTSVLKMPANKVVGGKEVKMEVPPMEKELEKEAQPWSTGGFFKIAAESGRPIFTDPNGKPFYSIAMVYAYGPESGPNSKNLNFDRVKGDFIRMKNSGFNTLDLYGSLFLDEMLSWCDENNFAVYFRTSYTDIPELSRRFAEYPDFMDSDFREMAKHFYDKFLNTISKYHSVLAIDMDQRWLFELDWSGAKRFGTPKLGPKSVAFIPTWLGNKYGSVENLNRLWGKKYIVFQDVLNDSDIIKNGVVVDLDKKPWRVDIIEYTLWTCNDFLTDLTGYMRSIDPNHLITYTTELPEVVPFPLSTKQNSGIDFISPVHYNNAVDYGRDWVSNAKLLFNTKFHYDLQGLPVYINETGFRTKPLLQNPPMMNYASSRQNDELHMAELYLRQTLLMQAYPWVFGWGYFKFYDKLYEGDFGYITDDRTFKPISKLGYYINGKLPINMKGEKDPLCWVYYPEYAVASNKSSFMEMKALMLLLENDFIKSFDELCKKAVPYIKDDPANIIKYKIFDNLSDTFEKEWVPFKFTSTIPSDDLPIILAGRSLEELSIDDRIILSKKRTVTFGKIGIYDERYNKTPDWYLSILGLDAPMPEEVYVYLDSAYNNDGISYTVKADGDFNGENNNIGAEGLPRSGEKFLCLEKDISFIMPPKEDGKQNNIKAKGQTISVPKDTYASLNFLIASESGDVNSKVTLKYADGTTKDEYLGITINDWRGKPVPLYGHIAVSSIKQPVKTPLPETVGLEHIQISAKSDSPLEAIILPNEDKIHVFAITLIKKGDVLNSDVTVSAGGEKVRGVSPWYLSLGKTAADFNTIGTFSSGDPAIIATKDGRHTAFLYDPLTWKGQPEEMSSKIDENAKILKKILFEK